MENKHKNLVAAVLAVMSEVEGIEKSMDVGTGQSSYKGVPDKEVKRIIGSAMRKNGLVILPIGIEAKTEVSRWEEKGNGYTKQKQSVFSEVITKYKLMHESGESEILMGYGHGVDSQDKGAGKASTYALKYTLLYTFLVPTGKIDDSDNTHSADIPVKPQAPKEKAKIQITPKAFDKLIPRVRSGEKDVYTNAMNAFIFTPEQTIMLEENHKYALENPAA